VPPLEAPRAQGRFKIDCERFFERFVRKPRRKSFSLLVKRTYDNVALPAAPQRLQADPPYFTKQTRKLLLFEAFHTVTGSALAKVHKPTTIPSPLSSQFYCFKYSDTAPPPPPPGPRSQGQSCAIHFPGISPYTQLARFVAPIIPSAVIFSGGKKGVFLWDCRPPPFFFFFCPGKILSDCGGYSDKKAPPPSRIFG